MYSIVNGSHLHQIPRIRNQEEPQPCRACRGLGYRGQTALCEVTVLGRCHAASTGDTASDGGAAAGCPSQAGNHTLQEEGILLVAQGVTSINELQRVMKQ